MVCLWTLETGLLANAWASNTHTHNHNHKNVGQQLEAAVQPLAAPPHRLQA